MTQRKVWRYKCGFCKKSGCSKWHVQNHEKACTANPDRVCGLCAFTKLPQKPIAELLAALDTRKPDAGMKELRELTEDCPACILAALRQSEILKYDPENPENPPPEVTFEFKAELKSFWENENAARAESSESYRYESSYL